MSRLPIHARFRVPVFASQWPYVRMACAVLLLTGCRAAILAYGSDAATARSNADAVMLSLEQRFTHVVRTPKFANARLRIARFAFAPSKLADDTTLWTAMRGARVGRDRELEVSTSLVADHYTFVAHSRVPMPARTGEARHFIRLLQLSGDDDWQWTTTVDHAIGPMPPARATDIMRALFASAEHTPAAVRADYRAMFPRSATAMGRMLHVDSINTAPQSDGSTLVALHVLATDEGLTKEFPALAKFVRKYLGPARYRYQLTDKAGGTWFDAQFENSRLILRFRSHDGELQPLLGVARHMPDTLALRADVAVKLGLFTVGVRNMTGEFVHVSTLSERSWRMRFTKEPEWQLPLITERVLHGPLKRPFEGAGLQFRIGFVKGPDAQTLLSRSLTVAVNESTIMRFLGNLGFTAMSDYAGKTEEEENRFLAEAFAAARADIAALR